jgi:LPXTG-motif cell wall-anchored protein
VTFTPEADFVGVATPISYVIKDILGQSVSASIHPTVTPHPQVITIAGQRLPMTGSDLLALIAWALVLFGAGLALVTMNRRRTV